MNFSKKSKNKIKLLSCLIALITLGTITAISYVDTNANTATENFVKPHYSNINDRKTIELSLNEEDFEYNILEYAKKSYINSNAVAVKAEPNDESEIIGILDYSNVVYVQGEDVQQSQGWTKIYYNNDSAYIQTDYISDEMLFIEDIKNIFVNNTTYLRSSPSADSDDNIVKELTCNDQLVQVAYNSEWIKVLFEEETYYLETKYFSQNMLFFEDERSIYVTEENAYLVKTPYDSASVVCDIAKLSELEQLSANKTWAQVKYEDNIYYIEIKNTSKHKPIIPSATNKNVVSREIYCQEELEPVIQYAYKLLSQAVYRYHQCSPTATDCSGLTMQCYAQIGVSIPWGSSDQASVGIEVDFNDMQPGDILCFSPFGSSQISHVALYVGDGYMVHAANEQTGLQETTLANYMKYGGVLQHIRRVVK